ncbi:PA2169 family four-helix-bundle protein [Sphingobacterium deserti]|uniref:DUF2383 domain-containing protein n=1 Tax=Sphingobacterium deserti TaxID=1229276 RepID=A0A0B8T3S4_9SPHI|nr:PA2169 family four-helix-bundle protein [Sphingobacterium deserti]KGE15876.1 hypothetical protein DI53_0310 [Sphingobacterium deserti]
MGALSDKNIELLNDLIAINNDRIEGYAKAIDLVDKEKDIDIISLFEKIGQQSQQFKAALTPLLVREGERPTETHNTMGELYRMWMDTRIGIAGDDRYSILAACEKAEAVFEKIYVDIWRGATDMPEKLVDMIKSQSEVQKNTQAEVASLRDEHGPA